MVLTNSIVFVVQKIRICLNYLKIEQPVTCEGRGCGNESLESSISYRIYTLFNPLSSDSAGNAGFFIIVF